MRRILKWRLWLVFLPAVTLCASCAIGPYSPEPNLAAGVTRNVAITKPVAILSDQTSEEPIHLPRRKIVVDRKSFTESLVAAIKMELASNNVAVTESADKKLLVSVTNIRMFRDGATLRAEIDAEVKTGSGELEKFVTSRASYGSDFNRDIAPTRPIDSAFRDLVQKILTSKNILQYLNN